MKQFTLLAAIILFTTLSSCSSDNEAQIDDLESVLTSEESLNEGEKIFQEVCTKCHRTSRPSNKEERMSMLAPPIMGVMFHVNDGVKASSEEKKQKVIDFIVDYAHYPSAEKSFCEKGAIKRFGVMPSQKENISKEELILVANYLYGEYPSKNINHDELEKDLKE